MKTRPPELNEIELELARRKLFNFTTATYERYVASWHHLVMCEYLDKFVRGQNQRLMILAPPRHGKSEIVSRRLPAFILGRDPDHTLITASYGSDLASRMNRDVQRIIDSPTYAKIFPKTTLFGQNIRTVSQGSWLRNSDMFEIVGASGYYLSSGVGGAITGSGAHTIIIDDPVKNRKEANSATFREMVWEWYTSTLYTRLAPGGNILLTVTRWHEDDLAGRLIAAAETDPKADQWTILRLRAVAEAPLEPYDPRQVGEALWRTRWDEEEMERKRLTVGSYDWASLYQQRPSPREGGFFKREWFTVVGAAPAEARRIRYWDKAGSTGGQADYTVGILMAAHRGQYWVEDMVRGRWTALERDNVMLATASQDRERGTGSYVIWHEQEGGSGGKDSAAATTRNLAGHRVYSEVPSGDKETRAGPFSAQCEARNVFVVAGKWNEAYFEELTAFPNAAHDDVVDGSSGAFNRIVTAISKLVDWA